MAILFLLMMMVMLTMRRITSHGCVEGAPHVSRVPMSASRIRPFEYPLSKDPHDNETHLVDTLTVPLYQSKLVEANALGCQSQLYSVEVKIEDSPFRLLVDSGSATLAVASSACPASSCEVSPKWQIPPDLEPVSRPNSLNSTYGDGSGWLATAYQQNVSIGNASAYLAFAAIDQARGSFFSKSCSSSSSSSSSTGSSEGILGMAFSKLAIPPTQSFFQTWIASTGQPNIFAMQMCHSDGSLWLGGYDSSVLSSPFHWTSLQKPLYYSISVSDIQLNGASLLSDLSDNMKYNSFSGGGSAGGAIVDTGTNVLALPESALSSFNDMLNNNSYFASIFPKDFMISRNCISGGILPSPDQLNANLPNLTIVIRANDNGSPLVLSLKPVSSYLVVNYLTSTSRQSSRTVAALCPTLLSNGNQGTILGFPVLNQFIVAFDIGMNRLGFATYQPNTCPDTDPNTGQYTGIYTGEVVGGVLDDQDSFVKGPTTPSGTQPPLPPYQGGGGGGGGGDGDGGIFSFGSASSNCNAPKPFIIIAIFLVTYFVC